jgi:hypothetical protein
MRKPNIATDDYKIWEIGDEHAVVRYSGHGKSGPRWELQVHKWGIVTNARITHVQARKLVRAAG